MTAYEIFMTILVLVMCGEYIFSSLKYKKLADNYEKIADKYGEIYMKYIRLLKKTSGEDNDKTDSSR